jgi:ATP phosphoribosyltransferase
MSLKLGIPSKGRLQADTIAWFETRGIKIVPATGGREYTGSISGVEDVSLVMLSAGEIPRELAAGRIHYGLTGRDMVEEKLPGFETLVRAVATPGFGFADLVIAVPAFWSDVETMDDLDAVAAAFRARHGFRLRIATKYHNLVRDFLSRNDIADYQLVDSQGATEGTVRHETAEAIADITSTGDTLRANHLKILKDGLVLKSEALLYRSEIADGDGAAFEAMLRD